MNCTHSIQSQLLWEQHWPCGQAKATHGQRNQLPDSNSKDCFCLLRRRKAQFYQVLPTACSKFSTALSPGPDLGRKLNAEVNSGGHRLNMNLAWEESEAFSYPLVGNSTLYLAELLGTLKRPVFMLSQIQGCHGRGKKSTSDTKWKTHDDHKHLPALGLY